MAPLRCFGLLLLAVAAAATDPEDSEDCGLYHCIPCSSATVFALRDHAQLQVLLRYIYKKMFPYLFMCCYICWNGTDARACMCI